MIQLNPYSTEYGSDPEKEYDIWCAKREEAYRAFIAGKTCGDCSNCSKPDERDWENPERMGYCRVMGEFVSLDNDTPEDFDCEGFV